MAAIIRKVFDGEGGHWVVRHTEGGSTYKDEFQTRADAEVFKRRIDGPEPWELAGGPIVRDETHYGQFSSFDRHAVYHLVNGQRRKRTFGDAKTATAFCSHLKRSVAPTSRPCTSDPARNE